MRRVAQPTRLILFLSLVVVAGSIGLAVLVFTDREPAPEAGADPVKGTAPAQVDDEEHGSVSQDNAGSQEVDLGAADDPGDAAVEAAVAEACRQFRTGSTVADFAVWFESTWVETDAGTNEIFREVVETALTQTCPEVVPSD